MKSFVDALMKVIYCVRMRKTYGIFSPILSVYLGCMYAYSFFILKHGIIKILVTFMMTWNAHCHFLLSEIDGSF